MKKSPAELVIVVIVILIMTLPAFLAEWHGLLFGHDVGDTRLPYLDDSFSETPAQVDVPFIFYEKEYQQVYVLSNGAVSFIRGIGDYTPDPLPLNLTTATPIIAPFWADIDTSRDRHKYRGENQGVVYYRTTSDARVLATVAQKIHKLASAASYQPQAALIVTWWRTTFFVERGQRRPPGVPTPENSFQLILATDGSTSYACFIYGNLTWTAGMRSHGDLSTGRITSKEHQGHQAVAGFDAGDQKNYYMIPLSGTPDVLKLQEQSNVGQPGLWVFKVDGPDIGETPSLPEPMTPDPVHPYMIGPLMNNGRLTVRCAWNITKLPPPGGHQQDQFVHQVVFLFNGTRSKRVHPVRVNASVGHVELSEKYLHGMLGEKISCIVRAYQLDKPGRLSRASRSTNTVTLAVQVETGFPPAEPVVLQEGSTEGHQLLLRLQHPAYCRGQPCNLTVPISSSSNVGIYTVRGVDTDIGSQREPCRVVMCPDGDSGMIGKLNLRPWPFGYVDGQQRTAQLTFGAVEALGSIWHGYQIPNIQVAIQPAAVAMCSITRIGITTFNGRVLNDVSPGQYLVWKRQLYSSQIKVHVRLHHCPEGGSTCPCGVMARGGAGLLGLDMCEAARVRPADYLSRVRIIGKLGYGATVTKDDTGRHFSLNMPSGYFVKVRLHAWGMGIYIYTQGDTSQHAQGFAQGLCVGSVDSCMRSALVWKQPLSLSRIRRALGGDMDSEEAIPDISDIGSPSPANPPAYGSVQPSGGFQRTTSAGAARPPGYAPVLPPTVSPSISMTSKGCSIPRGQSLFERLPSDVYKENQKSYCSCDSPGNVSRRCIAPYDNTPGRPSIEASPLSVDSWHPAAYQFNYGKYYRSKVKNDSTSDIWCEQAVTNSTEYKACLAAVGMTRTVSLEQQELVKHLAQRITKKCRMGWNYWKAAASVAWDPRHALRPVVEEELREGCLQVTYNLTSARHDDIYTPARHLLVSLCEPGCEQHGRCEQGSCVCQQGYKGLDCMVPDSQPLTLHSTYVKTPSCSIQKDDCPPFVSYHVDPIRQTEQLLCLVHFSCSGMVKTHSEPAVIVSYNELRCQILSPRNWVLGCHGNKHHYFLTVLNVLKGTQSNTVNITISCETCEHSARDATIRRAEDLPHRNPIPFQLPPICEKYCSKTRTFNDSLCSCTEDVATSNSSGPEAMPEYRVSGWPDLGSCTVENRDCLTELSVPVTDLEGGDVKCHIQYKKMMSDGSWLDEGQRQVTDGRLAGADMLTCPVPDSTWWHKPETTGHTHAYYISYSVDKGLPMVGGRYLMHYLNCPGTASRCAECGQPLGTYIALTVVIVVMFVLLATIVWMVVYWKRRNKPEKTSEKQITKRRSPGGSRMATPMKATPIRSYPSPYAFPVSPATMTSYYQSPHRVPFSPRHTPARSAAYFQSPYSPRTSPAQMPVTRNLMYLPSPSPPKLTSAIYASPKDHYR